MAHVDQVIRTTRRALDTLMRNAVPPGDAETNAAASAHDGPRDLSGSERDNG